jgi:hypothetical protein
MLQLAFSGRPWCGNILDRAGEYVAGVDTISMNGGCCAVSPVIGKGNPELLPGCWWSVTLHWWRARRRRELREGVAARGSGVHRTDGGAGGQGLLAGVAGASGGRDRGQPHEPGRDTARNRAHRRRQSGQPSAGSSAEIVAAALLMRLSSRGEWWICRRSSCGRAHRA